MPYFEKELYSNELQYKEEDQFNNSPYIEMAECVFQHICTTTNLTTMEKIYYLLLDCEAIVNLKLCGNRTTASTAKTWAVKLGCSKPQIFAMQKSLERKEYLDIKRSSNLYNQNNRNLLSTSLPKNIFKNLVANGGTDRLTKENKSIYDSLDVRAYLDQTKILLKINFILFRKIVASRKITYIAKLFCVDYYSPCYLPNIMLDDKGLYHSTFTYSSLMERYNITRAHLSNILTKLNRMHWIDKHRVKKISNPPVWNAFWYPDNIKNAA